MKPTCLVLGLAAILVSYAPAADACSCEPDEPLIEVSPSDGAAVPINTKLWFGSEGADVDVQLYAPDLDRTFEIERIDNGNTDLAIAVYRPVQLELPPFERFFVYDRADIDNPDRVPLASFTTTDETATPPATPSVVDVSTHTSWYALPGFVIVAAILGGCPSSGVSAGSVRMADGGFINVMTVDIDPEDARHVNDHMVAAKSLSSSFGIGTSNCRRIGNADGPLASETVRVGSFDIAGNFSGWSDPATLTYPLPGCSCSAQQAGGDVGWGALWWPGVLLLCLRSRRSVDA